MAVTVSSEATGTLSSTGGGTEDTVVEEATAGVFRVYIDLSNLEGVDATITVREYVKVVSGGAYKLVNVASYHGTVLEDGGGGEGPALELPTREVLHGYKVTLADSGASKSYPWTEVEIGG